MSEKLKIVYRPLQELSPYAHNARTHSPEQVAQLVESIKQFGWTNPVLIDEKGEIIAGHGRVMAAEMLKMDSVPVIVLSGLTDEQKKAYRLADNRLPMNAGWDEDLLRMELSDLINADFDVSLTGFIPTEIDELLTDVLPGIPGKFLSLLMMKIRHGISTWLNLVNRCWCFPKPISPVVLTKPIISVTAAQFFTPVMPVSTWQNWSGVNTSFSSMMIITSSSFGWIATMTRPIFR
ncbi:ParB/Srx family N-terminal domain-containing protein [Escherichia coli]|nr:ParB/Srx family N-terminal domain-containing protein [Escherichia coli]MCY6840016.1 ParB/Srx family N-terminal domain-containing protein [Escherichia coli]MCZ4966367.1 ParB/Srx family N-terminal domain-containing protein [Escherichia coli]MCZ4999161.1 ParB/Srx family N-terminal domain-containing protein [Escherichia coli]MCZ5922702.1 ParB/Srx family N-terminal domain-containing protein [Escherichia coli]MCZ5971127.1 ParB/Srx family N-terminal domain-containing protein [Escherichia coli]